MATIDPNGVLIYQDTDNYTPIQTALNLAQSNLSSILGANTQIVKVSSVSDRNAKAAARGNISSANPFISWRADAPNGKQLEVTTNGTSWNFYETGYDTGWLTLSGGTINVWARRSGNVVTVSVDMSTITGITDDVVVLNGGAAVLPVDMRPPREVHGSGLAEQPSVSWHAAALVVKPGGAINMVKPKSATTSLSGTVTYVL